MKARLISLLAAALLVACGGATSSSVDPSQHTQQKTARPSIKQDNDSYASAVQSLYIAYFGRPADPAGLANFEAALAAANAPPDVASLAAQYATNPALASLIDTFGTSKESQTLYGSGATANFVIAVFNNVLGRPPLSGGLSFWVNAIDSGQLSSGDAALSIMAGALTNPTAQGKLDAQLIDNRMSVAAYYTSEVAAFGLTGSYAGSTAAANARTLLSNVTATTDLSTYMPTVAAAVASMAGSGPIVEMFAGTTGGPGNVDGPAGVARFNEPYDAVMDSSNNLYVADPLNRVIRKVAPDGSVTTYAGAMGVSGTSDGAAASARFTFPSSLTVDAEGNVYVLDSDTVRKITPAGQVSTIAGVPGLSGAANGPLGVATFSNMGGIAVDGSGNLYVSDNHAIRLITPQGQVSTYAGTLGVDGTTDGAGSAATFDHPGNLAIDSSGNLYVVEIVAPIVRKVTPGGTVVTIAGNPTMPGTADGNGAAASFIELLGVAVDASGNVYVTDAGANDVREIDTKGNVTHYTGQSSFTGGYLDGAATSARFSEPWGLGIDPQGNLYVADAFNAVVRKVDISHNVTTYAGQSASSFDVDGTGTGARFASPAGMAFDASGNLYVADATGPTVRKVTPTGVVTTYAGENGENGSVNINSSAYLFQAPGSVVVDSTGNVFVADATANLISKITPSGAGTTFYGYNLYNGVQVGNAQIPTQPQVMAMDQKGTLYFVDSWHARIYTVTANGDAAVFAGSYQCITNTCDGNLATATFNFPTAIAFDPKGNLFVIDANAIRKIDTAGNVTTVAGTIGNYAYQDGNASSALFDFPTGLAIDTAGNVYVADYGNNAIRKISAAGTVSTIVGQQGVIGFETGPAPAAMAHPRGLALVGNTLYVSMEKGIVAVYNLPQ